MFTLLWKWLVSIFTADKIGVLVRALLIHSGKKAISAILDPENQKKAYQFVKELNARTDLNNFDKAVEFNKKMVEWAAKLGKTIILSEINCLRELAVSALKAESEKDTDK